MRKQAAIFAVGLALGLIPVAAGRDLIPDLAILIGLASCLMTGLFMGLTSQALKPWTRKGDSMVLAAFLMVGAVTGVATGYGAWLSIKSKAERGLPNSQLRARAEDYKRDIQSLNENYERQKVQTASRHQSQMAATHSDSGKHEVAARHAREVSDDKAEYEDRILSHHAGLGLRLFEQISDRLPRAQVPKQGRAEAMRVFRGKEVRPDSVMKAALYLEQLSHKLP